MLGRSDDWARTFTYGAAHYGKSLFWYGGEVLFAFFLTEVAGLHPGDMALVLATGFIVSAVFDLHVGRLMARGRAGVRRAGALQAAGALLSGAMLVAFFATPLLAEPLRIGWALCAGVAFRFAFSVYDIPQGALMAAATVDEAARSRVATTRNFGSGLASLTIAGAVGPLIAAQRDGGGGLLLMALAAGASVVAVATALALWRVLSGSSAPPDAPPWRTPLRVSAALARLWPLFAMMFILTLGPPLFLKLEPYFALRSFPSATLGGAIIVAAALGVCCGQPLWLRFPSRASRRALFGAGAALQAIGALIFFASPVTGPVAFIIGAGLFGLGNGGLGMALWASFSDSVAREPPHLHGVSFAAFAATGKVTLALGTLLVAVALGASGGEPGLIRQIMTAGPVLASLAVLLLVPRLQRAAVLRGVDRSGPESRQGGPT